MYVHISTAPGCFSPLPMYLYSLLLKPVLPLLRSLNLSPSPPPPTPPPHSLWFSVGFSSAITQTQPVSTDNSCLLFNTVQRAAWQAKIWKHFLSPLFLHDFTFSVLHSWFKLASSRKPGDFSFSSNTQSYHISKIIINWEKVPFR